MAKGAMILILGIGFVYRLLFLAKNQLSTAELMQALAVRSDSAAAMLDRLRGGFLLATPLDPLIQRVSAILLGESAWSLRLHAVVFGTLSIWLCYRVARFLFGPRIAAFSAALFALYPLHHHCSQEGLPYALSTFFALLSYDLLLRLVARARSGWRWWLAWTGVQVLLLFSGTAGIAILLSQAGALLLSLVLKTQDMPGPEPSGDGEAGHRVHGIRLNLVLASIGCAALACALFWPWVQFGWAGHAVTHPEGLSYRLPLRILKELGDGSWPMSGLLTAGVATGVVALLRHGRTQSLLWLAAWFAIPPGIIYLLDRWAGGSLTIGQILPCTPPLVLIAGYGMSRVGERLTLLERLPSQVSSAALVYAALTAVASVAIAQSHWKRTPVDWQGTAQYLHETLRAGDELTVPAGLQLLEYYAPRLPEFATGGSATAAGSTAARNAGRPVVVCLASLRPDPCATVRAEARKNRSWKSREFAGLTVFTRE